MMNIQNLSFAYPKSNTLVLEGLNFSIKHGEIYGLLGPSGSGKSTTQKIPMGLLPKFSGEAQVFGKSIKNVSRSFYEKIGVSFELPTLYLRLKSEGKTIFLTTHNMAEADEICDRIGFLSKVIFQLRASQAS